MEILNPLEFVHVFLLSKSAISDAEIQFLIALVFSSEKPGHQILNVEIYVLL